MHDHARFRRGVESKDVRVMMEAFAEQMSGIAEIQRNRSRLTATVTACDKRITVTVNADGILIGTKFADDIKDLTYEEIATAMTQSVQAASARRSWEVFRAR